MSTDKTDRLKEFLNIHGNHTLTVKMSSGTLVTKRGKYDRRLTLHDVATVPLLSIDTIYCCDKSLKLGL